MRLKAGYATCLVVTGAIALNISTAAIAASNPDAPSLGVVNTSKAAPSGSPIQIETCDAEQARGSNLLLAKSDRRFKIDFTNEGNVAADLVRFRLHYGDEDFYIRDQGSFAPGVTITHGFKHRGGNVFSSPLFGHTVLQCTVESAHFKDGSDWNASAQALSDHASQADNDTNETDRPKLGLSMSETPSGVAVTEIVSGSAADKSGLQSGDIIQNINGKKIVSLNEAIRRCSQRLPGQTHILSLRALVIR